MSHHSLLILTWDEDDGSQANQIPTIFAGQLVRPGRYAEPINHYSVLATIEAAYGLPRDGQAATATPITNIWRS
jgi:acid phosphatase